MSWMSQLSRTYDFINAEEHFSVKPWPVSHFLKAAHLEVVIDFKGCFKKGRTTLLEGDFSPTLIPTTESSSGRAGAKIAPHPLCEELSYCAGDLPRLNEAKYTAFLVQLKAWVESEYGHPKISAIYTYLCKRNLWKDISNEVVFPIKYKSKSGQSATVTPDKTFIRWRVEEKGNQQSGTWDDNALISCWQKYDANCNLGTDLCLVSGSYSRAISNHPRFLRNAGDGAKLISSNDSSGYTFRGRFTEPEQAVSVGFDISQKAHNALRWLINRKQCTLKNEEQVVVAWATSGKDIPSAFGDPIPDHDLWDFSPAIVEQNDKTEHIPDLTTDLGAHYAQKLKSHMQGYRANLNPEDTITIMAIDSATPGRMAVTYYREAMPKDYLVDITAWHTDFAWPQRVVKEVASTNCKSSSHAVWSIQAPSPYTIMQAIYGDIIKSNESLKKHIYQRLLPCLVERACMPLDLVKLSFHQACKSTNKEYWEWERNLGVACALYKGFYARNSDKSKRKEISMSLDTSITSRDYLYGRLLAVAEKIEGLALSLAGTKRPTTANRLMQRFADRPYSTWLTIFKQLEPYINQLRNSRAGFLTNRQNEIDEIMGMFAHSDFIDDKALKGEFLLGFHCQRLAFQNNKKTNEIEQGEEL
jgi:CRISPR-associated protein Csd1